MFSHFLFKEYFFDKGLEFFNASDEEKEEILNNLWDSSSTGLTVDEVDKHSIPKHNWNITYHIINEDECLFFSECVIIFIELPKPNNVGEAYYISLGVGWSINEYDSLIPFYMMLEYSDENTAYYIDYNALAFEDIMHYYALKKPVEASIKEFQKVIFERLNYVKNDKVIRDPMYNKDGEPTYNYSIVDHLLEMDGIEKSDLVNL
jgi:hypothetical protein